MNLRKPENSFLRMLESNDSAGFILEEALIMSV